MTAILFIVLSILFSYLIWRWWTAPMLYQIGSTPYVWRNQPEVDTDALEAACHLSVDHLCQLWPLDLVRKHLRGLQLDVMATTGWVDPKDKRCSGTPPIRIGPKFEELFHKSLHVLQQRIDGETDPLHVTWKILGYWPLDDQFKAALAIIQTAPPRR